MPFSLSNQMSINEKRGKRPFFTAIFFSFGNKSNGIEILLVGNFFYQRLLYTMECFVNREHSIAWFKGKKSVIIRQLSWFPFVDYLQKGKLSAGFRLMRTNAQKLFSATLHPFKMLIQWEFVCLCFCCAASHFGR